MGSAAPETVAVLGRAVMLLEKRGAVVEEAETPPEFEDLLAVHDRLIDWGMLTGLRYEHQFLRDRISPVTVGMLDNNLKTGSAAAFDAAYRRAQRLRFEIDRLFGDFDVLITPSAIGEAPEGLESTGDAIFNRGWTMLHVPCLTVPAGHGPKGLPLGVQLIARPVTMPGCSRSGASSKRHSPMPEDRGYEIHRFGDVVLQSGDVLADAQIAFKTHGTLAPDCANAISFPPGFPAITSATNGSSGPAVLLIRLRTSSLSSI